ncbi:MAG: AsmA family protein [Bdellovibrionales bacterium]
MIKKLVIGLGAIVVLAVVIVLLLGSNLDTIIKTAVEKYGSEATQTTATLNKVQLALTEGKASLQGFSLSNPKGFSSKKAIAFNLVSVELDPQSVMGDGAIVIKKVIIDAPQLTYEVKKDGNSNLQTIQKNVQAYANSLSSDTKAQASAPAKEEKKPAASAERKVIIERLVISNANVKLSHELLADKNLVDAKLPTIELTNLGKSSGGTSPAQIAQIVLQKLTSTAIKIGQSNLIKELRNQGVESLKGAVEQSGVGKAIGNIFGK